MGPTAPTGPMGPMSPLSPLSPANARHHVSRTSSPLPPLLSSHPLITFTASFTRLCGDGALQSGHGTARLGHAYLAGPSRPGCPAGPALPRRQSRPWALHHAPSMSEPVTVDVCPLFAPTKFSAIRVTSLAWRKEPTCRAHRTSVSLGTRLALGSRRSLRSRLSARASVALGAHKPCPPRNESVLNSGLNGARCAPDSPRMAPSSYKEQAEIDSP